jgi:xanthine/uracil permease
MKVPPFIIELLQRFATRNPNFFKVIQTISFAVGVVAFIPDLLDYLEIPSPLWMELLNDKAVKIGALTAVIMAQLPNDQPSK